MAAKTSRIKITLLRSSIGQKPAIRKTVTALGFSRLHTSVVKDARPEILGMVRTVEHLVKVEEVNS